MTVEEWITVPSWGQFQHYKDRNPTWIKLWLELASRDDWGDLSLAKRGLVVTIWIEFGASNGILSVRSLPQRCRQKVRRAHLDSLQEAGWIAISGIKPISLARSREKEKKVREERARASVATEVPRARAEEAETELDRRQRKARNWIRNGAAADIPLEHLGAVIADEFKIDDETLITDLVNQAQESGSE